MRGFGSYDSLLPVSLNTSLQIKKMNELLEVVVPFVSSLQEKLS